MLGAGLVREEDQLLGADTLGVDVDDELEADLLELAQAEVGDLDRGDLAGRQGDPGGGQRRSGLLASVLDLALRQHARWTRIATGG